MKAAENSNSLPRIYPDLSGSRSVLSRSLEIVTRYYAVARAVYPKLSMSDRADSLLFVLRSLRCHPYANDWFDWLEEPIMAPAVRLNPMLYRKIIRPYLHPHWTTERKLRVLEMHYKYVAARLTRVPFLKTCTPEGLTLLRISCDDEELHVRCLNHQKFSKEGELTVVLFSTKYNCYVSSLTWVIVERQFTPDHDLIIGGSQGPPADAPKNLIKESTKLLHGMRPKALLLFVTQEIAKAWQLDRIRAASNKTHISRHSDYALNSTRRPKLAYDEFWEESGGKRANDDFYDLPLHHVRRSDAEIKSNKRSLYRQRYTLMDCLANDIQTQLSALSPSEQKAMPALTFSG